MHAHRRIHAVHDKQMAILHGAVPASGCSVATVLIATRARPKSDSLATPPASSKTLYGLRTASKHAQYSESTLQADIQLAMHATAHATVSYDQRHGV